jgi:hypothetical protein
MREDWLLELEIPDEPSQASPIRLVGRPKDNDCVTESESQKLQRQPIAHRKPLSATIRQLYGTAFRCGKPDCGKPLYKMNNTTGETVLNSHVSHICARSEGGPRWDPEMSEGENRSESNLMPMCFEHAFEVDATTDHYPVDLLREWKRAQIAEHSRMQKGWPLTDDEAQQVIDASFNAEEHGIAIAAASSVTAAARAVGHLMETTRQQRQRSYEAASAWQTMRMHVQRSPPRAWDAATGELLPPGEPSVLETVPFREKLDATLHQGVETLRPLVTTLVAELYAVRAAVRTSCVGVTGWKLPRGRCSPRPGGGLDAHPRVTTRCCPVRLLNCCVPPKR